MRTRTLRSVVVLGAVILVASLAGWAGAATAPASSMGGYMGDSTGYGSPTAGVPAPCAATAPPSSMGGYMGDTTGYGSPTAGVAGSGCRQNAGTATGAGQGMALADSSDATFAVQS